MNPNLVVTKTSVKILKYIRLKKGCDEVSFEEEELIFQSLEYQGNRLNCGECLHCPRNTKDDVTKYTPCKMIDHDSIRFLPQIFNGYQGTIATQNICCYYEPAKWDISGQKEWRGLQAYIEFMDKFYYITPSFLQYNKIRHTRYITLVTGEGEDGDLHYEVSLYTWLTGNVFNKDGSINYINKKMVKKGRHNKYILIDSRFDDEVKKWKIERNNKKY